MLRPLLAASLTASVAVAAPVPKAPPAPSPKTPATFTLGTATVVDNPAPDSPKLLRFTYTRDQLVVGGGPAIGIAPRPVRPLSMQFTVDSVKVTTADGKEISGDDLTKKLADAVPMVRATAAFDAEWRKLFADDVLFLETVRPAGGGVINPLPGGGAVRPLPGIIRPRPVPLPLEPSEEVKPVEKK